MIEDIDRSTIYIFRILNQVKVLPRNERVPDVGLVMGDRATPAFTRAFALAGTQPIGVFLPGNDEAGPLHTLDFDAVGVATA